MTDLSTVTVKIINENGEAAVRRNGKAVTRPLRVAKNGFAVTIAGTFRIVKVVSKDTVQLTDKTVSEARPACFNDIGKLTKAQREGALP